MLLGSHENSAEHKIAVLTGHFAKVEHLDLRRREAVCAHSTIHTEPIRNSQREKAGDNGKRQGKLGHDWVL